MRLNKIDCKIIVKQENSKWYIHNILKNDFDAGEPLYNYIVYNDLDDEIGMSERELDLYEPQIGLGLFRDYLSDESNNSKNPKQKQMYQRSFLQQHFTFLIENKNGKRSMQRSNTMGF